MHVKVVKSHQLSIIVLVYYGITHSGGYSTDVGERLCLVYSFFIVVVFICITSLTRKILHISTSSIIYHFFVSLPSAR